MLSGIVPISLGYVFNHDNIIYVDDDGTADYIRIQDAIDNASDGDTIFVYNGIYYEHIIINKSIILNGENRETTEIYGFGENQDILNIKSNVTTVSNFTIRYGSDRNSGILIEDSSYVTISECDFFDIPSMDAVTISNSENITIVKCLMSDSIEKINSGNEDRYISGITLEGGCFNTTITNNIISNASYAGIIILEGCNNTRITGNYITSNDKYGIRAQHCNYSYIEENIISKNQIIGISILDCFNTFVISNSCENNDNAGVGVGDSVNIHVEMNNFIRNGKLGYFSYNFIEGQTNIIPDILWKENYWDRSRIFPKLIFGTIVFQKDSHSPIIVFPWLNFDWNPTKEPYDIPLPEL
jgi:parallel beta-helix repeat protein